MADNIFLLLGPEAGEKSNRIKQIEKVILQKCGEAPEKHTFYPFESKISDIISLMKNGSLFSAHKLVIIDNMEEVKKKADVDELIAYCKKPAEDSTLILKSAMTGIDKKIEKVITPNNKVIFWEMFENKKKPWITSYFQKHSQKILPEAAEHLLEMVENNTQEMKNACEKISFFFDKGAVITEEDIDNYLYHSREENVFTLFERIAARDLEASLEIYSKISLSSDSNPISVISGLLWQFKRLLNVKSLLAQKESPQTAMLKQGIKGKKNQKTCQTALQNYSLGDLENIVLLISKYDFMLRNAKTDMQSLIIQMLLYKCLRR